MIKTMKYSSKSLSKLTFEGTNLLAEIDNFILFFQDQNLDDNATRWTIFKRVYVRFFDYNSELDSFSVRYQVNENPEINEAMMQVKNHPDYGKCVSIIHDKFKIYGLYYLRAEYEFPLQAIFGHFFLVMSIDGSKQNFDT